MQVVQSKEQFVVVKKGILYTLYIIIDGVKTYFCNLGRDYQKSFDRANEIGNILSVTVQSSVQYH